MAKSPNSCGISWNRIDSAVPRPIWKDEANAAPIARPSTMLCKASPIKTTQPKDRISEKESLQLSAGCLSSAFTTTAEAVIVGRFFCFRWLFTIVLFQRCKGDRGGMNEAAFWSTDSSSDSRSQTVALSKSVALPDRRVELEPALSATVLRL